MSVVGDALVVRMTAGLASTWRFDLHGDEGIAALRRSGRPVLFAIWHGQLLAPLWHRRREGITLLVSGHRDGRHLAIAARRWGYRIAHGSSTRGGSTGLRQIVRVLLGGSDAALTPDGPRGPAWVVKPGAVLAARRSGAAIVPVAAAARSAWRASSWDAFLVPRPFACVRIVYGPPVSIEENLPMEQARKRLAAALDHVQGLAQC